jgi:hypothetical protein
VRPGLDAWEGQAEVKFESGSKLIKRFENVQRTQQEFWKRWIEEVFPEKLRQSKWRREKRDLKVGDIVLRKDETASGQTYKYAKVIKVHASTDDRVRAADIEYKLPGESVFRTTTKPIHKLVLVIPVEEQGPAADQGKGPPAPVRVEAIRTTAAPPTEVGSQAVCQTEPEVEKGEGLAEAETSPSRNEIGASQPAPSPKGRIPGKEATKQTRAIIVAAPKEEAEMVDIGARSKKRGRPRKNPIVDPPDPHKGSVLHPKKGVCADPVDKGAILGEGGGVPHSSDKERQLAPDIGRGKT